MFVNNSSFGKRGNRISILSDAVVCERARRWSELLQKYSKIDLSRSVNIVSDFEDVDDDVEDNDDNDLSDPDFEQSEESTDSSNDEQLNEELSQTLIYLRKRDEIWKQNGVDRAINSFNVKEIDKVGAWLKVNERYMNRNYNNEEKRTNCNYKKGSSQIQKYNQNEEAGVIPKNISDDSSGISCSNNNCVMKYQNLVPRNEKLKVTQKKHGRKRQNTDNYDDNNDCENSYSSNVSSLKSTVDTAKYILPNSKLRKSGNRDKMMIKRFCNSNRYLEECKGNLKPVPLPPNNQIVLKQGVQNKQEGKSLSTMGYICNDDDSSDSSCDYEFKSTVIKKNAKGNHTSKAIKYSSRKNGHRILLSKKSHENNKPHNTNNDTYKLSLDSSLKSKQKRPCKCKEKKSKLNNSELDIYSQKPSLFVSSIRGRLTLQTSSSSSSSSCKSDINVENSRSDFNSETNNLTTNTSSKSFITRKFRNKDVIVIYSPLLNQSKSKLDQYNNVSSSSVSNQLKVQLKHTVIKNGEIILTKELLENTIGKKYTEKYLNNGEVDLTKFPMNAKSEILFEPPVSSSGSDSDNSSKTDPLEKLYRPKTGRIYEVNF